MDNLANMLWIETRKALRSRMPLWTAIGSLFMPFGIAFLIFVSRNPEISQQLGLVSAKANLLAYAGIDWAGCLVLFGQMMAAGGFVLFILILAWVFGREFVDGTLKDMLAVPVPRSSIVLAKYLVASAWSAALAVLILLAGLLMGALIGLPGGSPEVILRGCGMMLATSLLTLTAVLPFALLASIGRGYLLPVGAAILTLMLTNIVALIGWGETFPWAVAGLHIQAKSALPPASYVIVVLTGIVGILATALWWHFADQT
jgi:ABC-2 type transport system permease protein